MPNDKLDKISASLGIGKLQRHIFLCADQSNPKCCTREVGIETWEYLKKRLKEHPGVYRTKVNCLRICQEGPIAVVYPEGVWYRLANREVIERIIDEHLIGGRPVEEYIFARDPLSPPPAG